jgi:hypothetical protein
MKQAKKFDILINEKETDPGTVLHFQLTLITRESASYQVFHSFYKEIQCEFPISASTKNLLLSLTESIITNSEPNFMLYLWGNKYEKPLAMEAKELNPQEPFNETTHPSHQENVCLLKTSIHGNCHISHPKDL